MKATVVFLLSMLVPIFCFADPIKYEPIPIESPKLDRGLCKIVDEEFAYETDSQIAKIKSEIFCGSYYKALKSIDHLYSFVEYQMGLSMGQGVCYDVRGCVEPNRLFNSLKSKSACKAAGGKSWKKTKPKAGKCKKVN